jgi:hypothetical protein
VALNGTASAERKTGKRQSEENAEIISLLKIK